MSALQPSLRALYRGIRRAAVVDVKRLMYFPGSGANPGSATNLGRQPEGYEFCSVTAETLQRLLAAGQAPPSIGRPEALQEGRQHLVAGFYGRSVVAYVWLACDQVTAEENFSRSRHLGTSLSLPAGAVFAHTAYTDPEHRGRRLLGGMLAWALHTRLAGAERMFATMDWTNASSQRAFVHLGFQQVGLIYRMGFGRFQASLYPAASRSLGLVVAAQQGGIRVALGSA